MQILRPYDSKIKMHVSFDLVIRCLNIYPKEGNNGVFQRKTTKIFIKFFMALKMENSIISFMN